MPNIIEENSIPEDSSYNVSQVSDIIWRINEIREETLEYTAGYAKLNAALKGLEEVRKETETLIHTVKQSLGMEEVGENDLDKEKQTNIEI